MGIASGHHTLSAREREVEEESSILSPINLSSSGCIYFTVFSLTCLHKLFFLQPLCFSNDALLSVNVIVVETRERGRRGLRTPSPSSCLQAVKVITVSFHLLYDNRTVYACNSSVKCVFTTLFFKCFCAPATIFPAFEIVCCIPTEQMMEIGFRSTNSQ